MKIVFVLIISLALLSGCESSVESVDEADFLATGVVSELGPTPLMYGTHAIENSETGERHILESDTINLDLYLEKTVGIRGETRSMLYGPMINVTYIKILSNE